jgi:hypothetical protein
VWLAAFGGAAGAVALAATCRLLDPLSPFPGLRAAPTVIGTALLLVAGDRVTGWARALGARPLTWIGDRSYAWYLWHWPALVLARQVWPEAGWAPPAAAVASLGVAAITYAAFEDRIRRDRSIVGRRALVLVAVCAAVSVVALSVASVGIRHGWGISEPDGWYDYPYGHDHGCLLYNRDLPNHWREPQCTVGRGTDGVILVLGDEHGDGVASGVVAAAGPRRYAVAELTRSGCPMLGRAPVHYARCAAYQREALALVDRLHPVAVVIGNRGPTYVDVDGDLPIADGDGDRPASTSAAISAWGHGLDDVLGALDRRHVPVVLVGAPPDFGSAFPRMRFSPAHRSVTPPVLARRAVERADAAVTRIERRVVARHPRARRVDALASLCTTTCRAATPDGTWLFYEPTNITATGGRRLAPALADALDDLLGRP